MNCHEALHAAYTLQLWLWSTLQIQRTIWHCAYIRSCLPESSDPDHTSYLWKYQWRMTGSGRRPVWSNSELPRMNQQCMDNVSTDHTWTVNVDHHIVCTSSTFLPWRACVGRLLSPCTAKPFREWAAFKKSCYHPHPLSAPRTLPPNGSVCRTKYRTEKKSWHSNGSLIRAQRRFCLKYPTDL